MTRGKQACGRSIAAQKTVEIVQFLRGSRGLPEPAAELLKDPPGALGGGHAHRIEARVRIERSFASARTPQRVSVPGSAKLALAALPLLALGPLTFALALHGFGKLLGAFAQSFNGASLRVHRITRTARTLPQSIFRLAHCIVRAIEVIGLSACSI